MRGGPQLLDFVLYHIEVAENLLQLHVDDVSGAVDLHLNEIVGEGDPDRINCVNFIRN